MTKLPNDEANRAALAAHAESLKLIEDEVMGKNGPTCTCPDWWFPKDIREKARLMPHMYQGSLSHHESCARAREYEYKVRSVFGRKTRFA